MLGQRFQDALVYACHVHGGQERKDTGVPYIAHLLGVASLVLEAGGDEDQAIAGLLHDAAEDHGGTARLSDIATRFGERVARIVAACTDSLVSPRPPWRERKAMYVARLAEEPEDALLVSAADKLYNARAILSDLRRWSDTIFGQFSGGREGVLWYYRALVGAYQTAGFDSFLVDELDRTVTTLEAEAS